MPLHIMLQTGQRQGVIVAPVTVEGKPATVEGEVMWEVVSGKATVKPVSVRGAWVVSSGEPGESWVLVRIRANLGEGIEEAVDTIQVTVTHPRAQYVGLGLVGGVED